MGENKEVLQTLLYLFSINLYDYMFHQNYEKQLVFHLSILDMELQNESYNDLLYLEVFLLKHAQYFYQNILEKKD